MSKAAHYIIFGNIITLILLRLHCTLTFSAFFASWFAIWHSLQVEHFFLSEKPLLNKHSQKCNVCVKFQNRFAVTMDTKNDKNTSGFIICVHKTLSQSIFEMFIPFHSNNVNLCEAVGWNASFFRENPNDILMESGRTIMEFSISSIWFFFHYSSRFVCLRCTPYLYAQCIVRVGTKVIWLGKWQSCK